MTLTELRNTTIAALGLVGVVSLSLYIGSVSQKGFPDPITVDGKTIEFTWTDDNKGEDLLIYTDKQTYTNGFSHAEVYVAVVNNSNSSQQVELAAFFRDSSKRIQNISVLGTVTQDIPRLTYTQRCGTGASSSVCWQEQTGTTTDRVTKNIWGPLEVIERTIAEVTKEDTKLSGKTRKTVENFTADKKTIGFLVPEDGVVYYKVLIEYPAQSDDNFYFEAYGSDGGYGNLDPWFNSSWAYRFKVEIAPSKVGTTSAVTNFPVYFNLEDAPSTFWNNVNATGSDIRVTKSDGSTEVAFELVDFGTTSVTSAVKTFSTTGTTTWVTPAGAATGTISVWGAGGGGGDGANTGGGGGGGGAFASSTFKLNPGALNTVFIGTGGGGGGAGANGSNGGISYFVGSSTVLAAAGWGGLFGSAVNPAGGIGGQAASSTGSTTYSGGNGGTGNNTGDLGGGGGAAAGTSTAGASGSGQTGGTGVSGGGSGGNGGPNAGTGIAGSLPGGGGGGGENSGAAGANGYITVTYNVTPYTTYNGELHFLADSLSTTSTSTFYIYYGNPSAAAYAVTDTYGRNAVWVNYRAVYHLGNTTDSTGNGYTVTASGIVTYAKSKIGSFFDNSTDGGNNYFSTSSNLNIGATSSISITGWTKFNTAISGTNGPDWTVIHRYVGTAGSGIGWIHEWNAGVPRQRFIRFGTANYIADNSYTPSVDTWFHTAITFDGSTVKPYRDGSDLGISGANSGTQNISGDTFIGSYAGASSDEKYWSLDEFRFSNSALTPAWILTEYNNQSSTTTFYFVGSQEVDTPAGPSATSTDDGLMWFD